MDKIREAMSNHANALKLRGVRQEVLAGNMANADTPNYKAVDFDFASALSAAKQGAGKQGLRAAPAADVVATTHPRHLVLQGKGVGGQHVDLKFRTIDKKSLDNNTVDLNIERASFAENTVKYEAASQGLSGVIKTMRSAITGN